MPEPDDLSEFEAELADIKDPSPFHFTDREDHHGMEVFEIISPAVNMIVDDLVKMVNEGRPAILQYMLTDGMTLTAGLVSTTTLQFVLQQGEGKRWVSFGEKPDGGG